MKKIWNNCESCPKDSLGNIENNVTNIIKRYEDLFTEISDIKTDTDPVLLESLIPHVYGMSKEAEDGFLDTIDLVEGCLACQNTHKDKVEGD